LLVLETPRLRERLRNLPLLVALLHAVNPMAVESVAYLSSRAGLLATLFFLVACYFLVRLLNARDRGRGAAGTVHFAALIAGFFFLGCASKEIIATMPIMGALFLWMRHPARVKANLLGVSLVLLPLAIYMGYRGFALGNPFALGGHAQPDMDTALYFFTQIGVIVFYYGLKLFLPVSLNFEPDAKMVSGFADPTCLAAVGVLLLAGWFLRYQESRLMRFAAIWALVTVLPASSFIPLKQLATEHRTYLPGLGVNICVAILFLSQGRWTRWAKRMALCLVLLMALLAADRGLDYRTNVALWRDTAGKSPGKALTHNNLANALADAKLYDEARKELETALRLSPNYISAHINLGDIHFQQGRYREAQDLFDRILFFDAGDAKNHYNSGMVRLRRNKPEQALPYLQKAAAMAPETPLFHFALGNAYKALKRYDPALNEYRLVLKYQPEHLKAHNNIGAIFWELKSFGLAEAQFKKVIAIQEDYALAHQNLAMIYMLLGKFQQAITHLDRYIELVPDDESAGDLRRVAATLMKQKTP
ncbi:MAG: tetratricopeptide repeat protein, partial [Nitrospinales bacterium]